MHRVSRICLTALIAVAPLIGAQTVVAQTANAVAKPFFIKRIISTSAPTPPRVELPRTAP